jgi:hypothetical protein
LLELDDHSLEPAATPAVSVQVEIRASPRRRDNLNAHRICGDRARREWGGNPPPRVALVAAEYINKGEALRWDPRGSLFEFRAGDASEEEDVVADSDDNDDFSLDDP